MPTTEHTINDEIAAQLRETRNEWRATGVVPSENTGMLAGSAGRPDILIIEPNVSPVVIETEVLPAATVEKEAKGRLGASLHASGRNILSSIAVRLPAILTSKSGAGLKKTLAETDDLEMAMFTGISPASFERWPATGWIRGSIHDLSMLTQSASLPPHIIGEAAERLEGGVREAAGLLEEMAASNPGAIHKISEELRQEDGPQTRRMAAAILANAFVFHGSLAGGPGDLATVISVDELRGESGAVSKSAILQEWRRILAINYWPIFDIARRILEVIPTAHSKQLIDKMASTAERLLESRLMRSHDLTGAVFQKLIVDRKFLAAFYTTPSSAALLVGLAITPERPLSGAAWSDADEITKLRIADFACGTGTLLSTAYQRIGQLHELNGGDAESLHPKMMATALVGCDVLPAAAHLTASMLAGAHPTTKYAQSSILTVSYGKQPEGEISLGSLDLLDPQGRFKILAITAKAAEGMGEAEKHTWESLPHSSFDVVLMNPPFTRATGQHQINNVGVPNPMFAAFSSSDEEQRLMSAATKRLTHGTSAHGNAGEASIFLVLADRKLKTGGVLGLVMPLSLMSGDAWKDSRSLLQRKYRDMILISISGGNDSFLSFSADTDMGECLVLGSKDGKGSKRAVFVVLKQRPGSTLLGASCARQIRQLIAAGNIARIEGGPDGGTPLYFGDEEIGQVIDAPLSTSGGWHLARIADLSLAQTAYQLAKEKRVWLPTMRKSAAVSLPINFVSAIGEIGPGDRDINGDGPEGEPRGPFTIVSVPHKSAPTYPVLWAHVAARERTMAFEWDNEARPRRNRSETVQATIDAKAEAVFATASHCHFNRDFRFNSQSTAMQYTSRRTIGGRAWPSIRLKTVAQEKALVVWANTSLGVLMYWWYANKTQPGRGSILRSPLENFPVLDVTKLSKKQIAAAAKIFDETSDLNLLPINELDEDTNRKLIDERFGREVLGLPASLFAADGAFELLRQKLSMEPSIRGGKRYAGTAKAEGE
jgi:hypothetical protein